MTWRGRNIYLVGLPGAGKSAIGRELAKLLGSQEYEFVDLDMAIEAHAAQTIAELFSRSGEETFRKLETECLLELTHSTTPQPRRIVATGGGTVARSHNRTIMRGSGIVVWIDVSVREAAKNIERDLDAGIVRPLFNGISAEERAAQMREIHEARRAFYEQATLHFVTKSPRGDERTPRELAAELLKALEEMSFHVVLKPKFQLVFAKSVLGDYPVVIGSGTAAGELVHVISDLGITNVVTISDQNVETLHGAELRGALDAALGAKIRFQQITIQAGEKSKSKETLFDILEALHNMQLTRKSTLILALGGGVVTDIAALAASLFMRGLPVLHVPTTLLAQVDAAIGGKTGIDLFGSKNLIGTFYPPAGVIVDPTMLSTLPKRELHAGLAELVKYALIGSPDMWSELSGSIRRLIRGVDAQYVPLIKASILEKLRFVNADEFEKKSGVRELLNFGHTFGHALESATHFEVFLHGEAVALGMRAAIWLSKELGFLSESVWREIELILGRIPIVPNVTLSANSIMEALRKDKKRVAGHRLILLRAIGDAFVQEIPEAEIARAIEFMITLI